MRITPNAHPSSGSFEVQYRFVPFTLEMTELKLVFCSLSGNRRLGLTHKCYVVRLYFLYIIGVLILITTVLKFSKWNNFRSCMHSNRLWTTLKFFFTIELKFMFYLINDPTQTCHLLVNVLTLPPLIFLKILPVKSGINLNSAFFLLTFLLLGGDTSGFQMVRLYSEAT